MSSITVLKCELHSFKSLPFKVVDPNTFGNGDLMSTIKATSLFKRKYILAQSALKISESRTISIELIDY